MPQIQAIEKCSNEQYLFEVECMKKLAALSTEEDDGPFVEDTLPLSQEADPDSDKTYKTNLEALAKLKTTYAGLINKYPEILKKLLQNRAQA